MDRPVRVVWRRSARDDLAAIQSYLLERSSGGAARVWVRITERIEQLKLHPYLAPPTGKRKAVRLMAVPGTPYLIVYSVRRDVVKIEAIFHGAQDRRPR